jgi:hypothetical protein
VNVRKGEGTCRKVEQCDANGKDDNGRRKEEKADRYLGLEIAAVTKNATHVGDRRVGRRGSGGTRAQRGLFIYLSE